MEKFIVYKTGGWKTLIEEVEAEKVSDKSVWLHNGRSAKRSHYANYWDTINEAKDYLINKCNKTIEASELRISKAKADLEELSKY